MTSTPMDLDAPDSANGTPSASLNVARALGGNIPSTSSVTDVIATFRPTKVFKHPFGNPPKKPKNSFNRTYITAASVRPDLPQRSSLLQDATPMNEIDKAVDRFLNRHSVGVILRTSEAQKQDTIAASDSKQLFKRDDVKDGRPQPHILSLDYDDPGELLMTSESDETIQIYKVREGRHDKQLLSKKYGVKLAKFTHNSSSIVYASTKVNDSIRYLTTHDNAFIRYFEGHDASVTSLAMHPGQDDFISCSKDGTVRLWNASTKNATGVLYLNTPYLSAWDPSGDVFAIASPHSGQVLLYSHKAFEKAPFSTFDIAESCAFADPSHIFKGWTKLEFSNDGKSILLGTKGAGHFLIDSFDGKLKAYLHKPNGGTSRLAAGEDPIVNGTSAMSSSNVEGSGDCCFTQDGRYVLGGAANNKLLVWDTLGQVDGDKTLEPAHVLNSERPASVVACSPRFNFIATADQDLVFWVPDPHA